MPHFGGIQRVIWVCSLVCLIARPEGLPGREMWVWGCSASTSATPPDVTGSNRPRVDRPAAHVPAMSTFNEIDHPRAAGSGEFALKPQSAPELGLTTARPLGTLPVGEHAARAALVAAAGNHQVLFTHDYKSADVARELVAEIARLSGGKHVVTTRVDTAKTRVAPAQAAPDLTPTTTKAATLPSADSATPSNGAGWQPAKTNSPTPTAEQESSARSPSGSKG